MLLNVRSNDNRPERLGPGVVDGNDTDDISTTVGRLVTRMTSAARQQRGVVRPEVQVLVFRNGKALHADCDQAIFTSAAAAVVIISRFSWKNLAGL